MAVALLVGATGPFRENEGLRAEAARNLGRLNDLKVVLTQLL